MPILFKQSPSKGGGRIVGTHPSVTRLASGASSGHIVGGGEYLHPSHHRQGAPLKRQTGNSLNTLSSFGSSFARRASRGIVRAQRSRPPLLRFKSHWEKFLRYLRDPRLLIPTVKDIYRRFHLKHLIPLLFVAMYMLVGAGLFYWTENEQERARIKDRMEEYRKEESLLVRRIEEIAEDRTAIASSTTRRHLVEEAISHFHSRLQVQPVPSPQWSFLTAMYYAGTIFTTIGYGDVYCETPWGRALTVLYAIVGVPLMLITLNELGKFLYKSISESVDSFNKLIEVVGVKLKVNKKKRESVGDLERGEGTTYGGEARKVTPVNGIALDDASRRVSFKLNPEDDMVLKLEASDDMEARRASSSSAEGKILLPSSELLPPAAEPAVDEQLIPEKDDEGEAYDYDDEEQSLLLLQKEPPPRMPGMHSDWWLNLLREGEKLEMEGRILVLVALTCTVGWIFVCSALFKLWENFSYAESCYFMFISLSTIGLGDVQVQRKDLMVVCFVFVIVGLSLVSMCINVIQSALEDLYRALLMKILADYRDKLASGGDHKGASMGMMQMWGGSKTAKFLMPMLSAETRLSVMHKIQEEAKETGMELPPIFEDIDDKTGMPKILAMSREASQAETMEPTALDELVQRTDPTVVLEPSVISRSPIPDTPEVVCYEACMQTEQIFHDEKNSQTTRVGVDELAIQTDLAKEEPEPIKPIVYLTDEETQTDSLQQPTPISTQDSEVQTEKRNLCNAETMTFVSYSESMEVQTDKVTTVEQMLQTYLIEQLPVETQTDELETKNERIQTPYPEFETVETQTDELEELKEPSKISQATSRIRRVFQSKQKEEGRHVSHGDHPTMSSWTEHQRGLDDISEIGSSYESLNWDPIDGLHAEKQKPVKDLKKLFDAEKAGVYQSRRSSLHRRSLGSTKKK